MIIDNDFKMCYTDTGEKFVNKISIKSIQENLEKLEKETNQRKFYSLDFRGEFWLIVTKDEIYVKNWNPTCPAIPQLKFWNDDQSDEFDDCIYMHFEEYEDSELNNVVDEMIRECKYNERKFGE